MQTPPDPEEELARLIDQHLRRLPAPKAPRQLAPRVLTAIAARQNRPWWQKSWYFWPRQIQTLFVLATLSIVAFGGWYVTAFNPDALLVHLREAVLSRLDFARPLVSLATALGSALVSMARSAGQTFWITAACIAAVIYVTCVGLGTLCYRFAFTDSPQQNL